jgi:uncharacterized protein
VDSSCPHFISSSRPKCDRPRPGEAEVIALGIQSPESLLILDDSLGRRIADLYQLKYTGTLGVLIKAKALGHLDAIAPIIDQFRSQGMWLTDKIISDILRSAGE